MPAENHESLNASDHGRIDDSLVNELHGANEQLEASRRELDQALATDDETHQARVDQAAENLRRDEKTWEEVDGKVHAALRDASPPAPPA